MRNKTFAEAPEGSDIRGRLLVSLCLRPGEGNPLDLGHGTNLVAALAVNTAKSGHDGVPMVTEQLPVNISESHCRTSLVLTDIFHCGRVRL